MGNKLEKPVAPTVPNETYKSARNVLERYAENIKKQAENNSKKYESQLKGKLEKASFNNAHGEWSHVPRYGYKDPCRLDHRWNTNLLINSVNLRNPCDGRNPERFGEKERFVCRNKISDHKSENVGTSCAPPRRRHICDKNLEALTVGNTKNSDDLLGNILVTAKYEGDSIVSNHPYKGSSEVCIALARSFADIGDIIRGRDMFLGNNKEKEKIEKSLQNIFQNIQKNNSALKKLTDKQIREYWWAIHRKEVWKAITCNAPYDANYFRKTSDSTMDFTSEGQCGHDENKVLTNLDYVPQFLRWFDEWAEDFCRIRKYKLEKVKEACRNDSEKLYCSHNGYDCTKTIRNENILSDDPKCTGCLVKCSLYDSWLRNQRNEFEKQKEKYAKEIQSYLSNNMKSSSSINNEYYKEFYKEDKKNKDETVKKFLLLLNEGKFCKDKLIGEKDIDFTNTDEKGTFSHSKHCKVCPHCGVVCNNGTCTDKPNNGNCGNKETYSPGGAKTTEIKVIVSGNEQGDISKKLEDFCSDENNENGKNYQKWECYYKSSQNNKCKMETKSGTSITEEKVTSFDAFFDLWVKNLLRDSIKWETELKDCINNSNVTDCNNDCNKNCVCFDKWVKQKEEVWKNMKTVLGNQKENLDNYYNKLNGLFKGFFFPVMFELNHDEAKWNKLMENLKKKIESSKENRGTVNSQDAIELLLEYLKEKSTICKDNNTNEGCPSSKTSKTNPCGDKNNASNVVSVKQIAQYYKRQAYAQLEERGGRSNLKGDASKGEYSRNGRADDFKDLSKITKEHSNADSQSQEPCGGKGNGFEIGKTWEEAKSESSTTDVYIRPRRKHMCTSNLEYLIHPKEGPILKVKGEKINHSFLGDVLLAANYEADDIKNKLAGDGSSICRAMKYSFADIGDIIRGTDMWDKDTGEKKTQGNLVKIFKKIKEQINGKLNGKYAGDNDDNKYINLRKDWWEANRDQVWKAMTCKTNGVNITCDNDHTPLDDYIPQRLRWMTEWAEWYCKYQSQEYEELKGKCQVCKGNDNGKNCYKQTQQCNDCKGACEKYTENIKTWQNQWKTISDKYTLLYSNARIDAFNGSPDYYNANVQKEDQSVYDFLYKLHLQNGGILGPPPDVFRKRSSSDVKRVEHDATSNNTPYDNIGGYLHDTGNFGDCQKQNEFCDKKNGDKKNTNYAFRDKPHDHDEACNCEGRTAPVAIPVTPAKTLEEPCKIVEGILKDKHENIKVGECNIKNSKNNWDCDNNKFKDNHEGPCMPPRRQSLCVHYLTVLKDKDSKDNLRDAYIKTAAAETFLLWQKYKTDNNSDTKLQAQLENGTIPDDFMRIMFYTFADYRDIFFDTDISKKIFQKKKIMYLRHKRKDQIFPKSHETNEKNRQDWWKEYGPHIWKAMLCALEKAGGKKSIKSDSKYEYKSVKFSDNKTTLEEFAKRSQFLRWMTEWGENFCKQRKVQLDKLLWSCKDCSVSHNVHGRSTKTCETNSQGCTQCEGACKEYQSWLQKWRENYIKQKDKFLTDKENDSDANQSDHAYEYLKKKLENICQSDNNNKNCVYNCMKKKSTQNNIEDMPASLDEEPEEVQGKCSCIPPPSACDIVKDLFEKKDENDKYFNEACSLKYKGKKEKHSQWKCTNKTKNREKGQKEEEDEVCIPPRREKMYTERLQALSGKTSPLDLRKAFIETAAIETFFAWHKFKMDKKAPAGAAQNTLLPLPLSFNDEEEEKDPQEELKKGDIPEEFMSQMIYTFGDYKDILFGRDMRKDTKNISENILNILNSGQNDSRKPDDKREEWWEQYGKDIWDGMICALSYDTNDKKIKMDLDVHKNLIDEHNKKNNNKYGYKTLTISSIPINPNKRAKTSPPTTLSDFAKTPQFIRWFEEWAEEFCRKRKRKIDKIKKECRREYDRKYCSGDGHDCIGKDLSHNNMFADLDCHGCYEQCTNYKKWIKKKEKEFHNQKIKYVNEIEKLKTPSNNDYDQRFYENLNENYSSVQKFLESLKHSKHCKGNSDQTYKIDFNEALKTFSPSTYCKSCPLNGVKCGMNRCNDVNEKGLTWENLFNGKNIDDSSTTNINVQMIDGRLEYIQEDLKEFFKTSCLLKSVRDQKWICKFINNKMDVCKLNNFKESIDTDEIITFKVFIEHWLQDFLEGYNKSKRKIHLCTNKDENTCIKECNKNCECVEEWLSQKTTEWEQIKKHFNKQKRSEGFDMEYKVRIYFEKNASNLMKSIENFKHVNKIDEYEDCKGDNNCTSVNKKRKKDMLSILLNKLKKEINDCKSKHKENSVNTCVDPSTLEHPSLDEDENPDTSTDKQSPEFCPKEDIPEPPAPKDPETPKKPEAEPPEEHIPINCIDKAGYELQKEVTKNIGKHSNSLKGNGTDIPLTDCKQVNDVVVDNGVDSKKLDKDKLEEIFPSSKYSCENKGRNGFHIEKEWDCNYRNINFREKHLCLPPRRQFMCMKIIKHMESHNIKDKNELLEKVMESAKREGVRILKNYQEQNKSFFSEICDDMKYSFADLGDIIRGRDLWKKYPNYHRTELNLQRIFKNIHKNMTDENAKEKYKYDYPYYHNLRNDWWNENRESVWKAMTFSAPKDAYINKTTKNSKNNIRSTNMYNYCGHNEIPPYDDYIPQRLRWMKEWGEYVCKILNEKVNDMKNDCDKCKLNYKKCSDNDDGNKCKSCKEKCKEYTELIHNLKSQFSILEKIYNELYTKAKNNSGGFIKDNDKYVIEFFEKVIKEKLCDVDTPNKYLDKASHCINYNFTQDKIKTTPYAFNDQPEMYKNHCVCKITNHPLDKCPFRNDNNVLCNILKEFSNCKNKTFDNKLDSWGTHDLKHRTTINQGVFIPPRRTRLCLKPFIKKNYAEHKEHIFLNDFLTAAYTEAYMLGKKFKDQPTDALQAIKWSFADYGDIIKGTDMIDNMYLNELRTQLETILKDKGTTNTTEIFKKWWKINENKVWHVMLCGYNKAGGTINYFDCNIPSEENTDQFLRWFQEWTEAFCSRRNELYEELKAQCKKAACVDGRIYPDTFKNACEKYRNFIANKKIQYDLQMYQYNKKYKNSKSYSKEGPNFVRNKCNGKCECLSGKIIENSKLENPYETLEDTLKSKCDCQKDEPITPPVPSPPPRKPDELPTPSDEPFDPIILQTTIPFGIALALGSIAFLYLKKKTHSPVDLLRVLDIHKGDYGIPTFKSKNRYIPYGTDKYKGKTYIYMEGDSADDEKYAFMSDTTDITSSESEYEELDINDIYPYQSPKYKTLIEVVLEPSKRDTFNTQSDDIPTNKPINDEEWNELKHDFISNMLQNEQKDLPNDYTSGNVPLNTQPKNLRDNMEEKPFITSIHDRNLYTGEEYNYDMINNIGNNDLYSGIDPTSSNHGPYSSKNGPISDNNHPYCGTDLINDSLNSGNQPIDIYDELLKRKENELFGTNHVKQTSTHSVAKHTYSDPIHNQIQLFHEWLDRHRDMCEKWENHHERLAKLKEKWDKENNNNSGIPSDSNKMLNTNVSIEIDMDNPKTINIVDINPDNFSMDNMEDDIYYDVNDDDNNEPSVDDIPMDHNKVDVDVPKKVHVEMKIHNNKSTGSLEQQFPISDVWNI
ncbi:erythrocyte membrane protein 1, EMP1 [Plasmodium reichenowi]|uniref:Erythrocyte membrane protein 1, EMP1 n=1 Tax=Plasmodium reichenowi TaxID=5854 RepID=A0A060RM78_PLARE|nr:erythrocyte membrane protein 1, EMP1 [Plasmodium reichenowi]